jgi:hypothetical protein
MTACETKETQSPQMPEAQHRSGIFFCPRFSAQAMYWRIAPFASIWP